MSTPDYKRSELSVSLRVHDLLARMTPEEKARQLDMFMGSDVVDQMRSVTQMAANAKFVPAKADATIGELGCGVIHDLYPTAAEVSNDLQSWFCTNTRLGIPVLLVEEALHGFCRPDSTVFPQCIGLGATFDPGLVERIGGAIAAEMRAVGVHLSLSPVLCLARDPRWGRSEETYGEDPWLAGTMGEAYVRGMQGDLGLLNVAAGPKHFAGHGSPQGGLNQGPVHIGEREMHEVMLKAFRPAFTDGKALGAMCAYHEIDGIPCAANPWLLTELLRGEWRFEGVVIGDLGAIRQLLDKHRVAKDARDAICQALRAGVDIQFYDFDHATWMREISAAYRTGELEPEILDRAVSRVLALKFRLGLFDRAETDSELNCKVCRCRTHLDLSLEAARKSIVLLKNERGILPLRPGPKRVALLGPSADLVRLGDYAGIGDGKARTLLECLRELLPDSEIIHEKGVNIDGSDPVLMPSSWLSGPDGESGLRGAYFATGDLAAHPDFVRQDAAIDFNWAIGPAAPGLPSDGFAVRWIGKITPDRAHHGRLDFVTSDQVRVWLDDDLVIDAWDAAYGSPAAVTAPVDWAAGQNVGPANRLAQARWRFGRVFGYRRRRRWHRQSSGGGFPRRRRNSRPRRERPDEWRRHRPLRSWTSRKANGIAAGRCGHWDSDRGRIAEWQAARGAGGGSERRGNPRSVVCRRVRRPSHRRGTDRHLQSRRTPSCQRAAACRPASTPLRSQAIQSGSIRRARRGATLAVRLWLELHDLRLFGPDIVGRHDGG